MKLIRIDEVATKLGISKSGLRKLLKNNKVPKPMIIGDRTHVWNEATIDAWLESKERSSMSVDNMPHD